MVPTEVLGEILQFACGDYFDPEQPFAHDDARFKHFIANQTAFVYVAAAWRDAAYGVRDIARLLELKSSFPLLTALTIANIEPCVDRVGRVIQQPSDSILSGHRLSHLRLVGFGFSLAASGVFARACVLVLSDLRSDVAPTVPELYAFLLCATCLQALSIDRVECGVVCAENATITLEHLELLHFFCGANDALRALLLLLRAPRLTTFDAEVNSASEARFLEECALLLSPVTDLRVYGIHNSAKRKYSLMKLMPRIANIDLTTAARSFAAFLSS
ncbi:hypothetical protein B0H14DRAFT_3429242 [Mycena olivaceomarginata]|nr:hypothetical protein B0H14DRAFT_3429242 [Mycena olivaceomarginata]